MSVGFVSLLLFALLIVLLISGLPLAFIMGGLATIFSYFLLGPRSLAAIAGNAYGVMENFVIIAIPLFIFMGVILQRSGIAEDAYELMYKWLGGVRGGLAIGTVVVCTIFAALTGTSAAATISMGVIALPAMLKRGYNKHLAIGCICAGGTLGVLIPPSVLMIIYGVFGSESVGRLFAGGVVAGLVMSFLFMAYIAIKAFLQPQLAPAIPLEEKVSMREKLVALRGLILPLLLVFGVLGSIFLGVATPTEAAAIGSLGSVLCAAINHKLTWSVIKETCYQTLQLSGMVVWIILGSAAFTSLYASTGAIQLVQESIALLPLSPYLILIGIMFLLFILGMFLDPGAIIMLTVPIFVPLIKTLGFDPVWFGVLFIVNMQLGYLTPPFGFSLFYMKRIVPEDVTMGDIYKSVFPFVLIMIVCVILFVIFPEIIMWLPNRLFE
ncbi:TRAP transporter large permease subunit [Desulfosporosinus sp. BICA1-9]|uniref:TRAP transporter large permease n=1 Tax=Desulfosporosinus sp. BICA1-9 TaxID=1531958 RepID=UPI00054C3F55|nr:TRAP transporter large permease subunit [Desulfosporosinus sp. BICA1-9]KJS47914.1 MAG: TRAP dicarboxylate transporter subunit DctM [Peptococcaceae bacterium BRH_c23]KJS82541.1 MAG: TRAP dicarboxylate transporter subunit DctM [Desulfosporosinus sp. BICA1-9]HBW35771.1 TRAP transporter permease DctM [Desulfosporosinus sp.]